MSAAELRKAAETIGRNDSATLYDAKVDLALACWLSRTADIWTTVEVLTDAGVESLVLGGFEEALVLARLINGGAS